MVDYAFPDAYPYEDEGTPGSEPLVSVDYNAALVALHDLGAAGGRVATLEAVAPPSATAPVAANVDWWQSYRLRDLVFANAPGDRVAVLEPSLAWETTQVQEPSVWAYDGSFHMIYTGGTTAPRLGYASAPTPMGPWTKNATPVIGGSTGGITAGAYHSNIFRDGDTLYCHFVDTSATTTLKVATASVDAPTVWTLHASTYAIPAEITGANLWGNVGILKDAATYYMVFEVSIPGISWQLALGTLDGGPTGALTVTQTSMPTLRPDAGTTTATTSGPWLTKVDDEYVLYYHGGRSGSLPTNIYRATSPDLTTWTIDRNATPIISRSAPEEVDQVADVFLAQGLAGEWVAYWTAMDNAATTSSIMAGIARPALMRSDGTTWHRVGGDSDPWPKISAPQKPACYVLAQDVSLTGAAGYQDITGLVNLRFIPSGTRMMVRLDGVFANSTTANQRFRIKLDNGSQYKYLGSPYEFSGGRQLPITGVALFTDLTPGQKYNITAQVNPISGTWTCRPVALDSGETEVMSVTISDVAWPNA